uniref:45 kDa calcium-binding protein n=1 Tax=Strigamia maritima TaxID=126957 RepID=T1JJ73_STRMM
MCYLFFFLTLIGLSTSAPFPSFNATVKKPSLPLNVQDLIIPDHLEGVKLERDGHLNKEFRKEVFLGKSHEEIENAETLLTEIFQKVDVDGNEELSPDELSNWISAKVKEHLDEAVRENIYLFTNVDKDRNGLATWKEYHYAFMLDQGFEEKYARDHAENHKILDRKTREQILLDEAAFSETAHNNPDGLNIDEFLSFRHPERSLVTLLNMVQEIFNNLDENGDNYLSIEEFATFSNGAPDPKEMQDNDRVWQEERKREFRENIDSNQDGRVSRQELLFYSDPKNPAHAKSEARNLISSADTDHSGTLSLEEILAKKDIFLGSKMINISKNFHDEF